MSGSNERERARRAFNAAVAVAAATSLLTIWTTVVRDDGNGLPFFMLIMAAMVGGFSASFRATGLARAMAGVAIMQVLLGIGIATAPSTASLPGGASKALLWCAILALLWLISAAFFRFAAKGARKSAAH